MSDWFNAFGVACVLLWNLALLAAVVWLIANGNPWWVLLILLALKIWTDDRFKNKSKRATTPTEETK